MDKGGIDPTDSDYTNYTALDESVLKIKGITIHSSHDKDLRSR